MAYDPYGYVTDEPEPESSGGAVAAFLTIMYGASALCCGGFGVAVAASAEDPFYDKVGIFTLVSWPACVGGTAAVMTVAMWLATRRLWPSLGPSLIAGGVVGTGVWALCFLLAIIAKISIEG